MTECIPCSTLTPVLPFQLMGQYLLYREKDMKSVEHCQKMWDYLKVSSSSIVEDKTLWT